MVLERFLFLSGLQRSIKNSSHCFSADLTTFYACTKREEPAAQAKQGVVVGAKAAF